jgi:hypothetical protein
MGNGECGSLGRRRFGPCAMPENPSAEPELGDKVIVVIEELTTGVIKKYLGRW